MDRYSLINTKMPREMVLLQGTGCRWRKCKFCDYHEDISENPYLVNEAVLKRVTGCHGILDVINSGSAMEFDADTLNLLQRVVEEKNIHTIWFEAHYMYRNKLNDFAKLFAPAKVKFRCGVESFSEQRRNEWNKGIPQNTSPEDIAQFFSGVCLLCCVQGDTRKQITDDIEIAKRLFEYFSVNVFCNNGTTVKRDEELTEWFINDIYPELNKLSCVEVLLNNTDLGVG